MSDALSYLAKARPEAMGHYFAFLKDAGTLLDPKSRALISVITKVYAQTERGLLQYTRRALAEGCAPAEILDALLMAFPALGLSKIVWAVDVLLASELEEFSLENVGVRPDWRRLGAVTDFNDRTATRDRMRRPRAVRLPRRHDVLRIRQSLPAPAHQDPARGALRRQPALPQARLDLRRRHRRLHRGGRSPPHAAQEQGRGRSALRVLLARRRGQTP